MLDLDGVLWRGKEPIPGSAEAVAALRDAGHRVAFLTNNSFSSVTELAEKLGAMGVPAEPEDICNSAQAAAGLLDSGTSAYVVGGPGISEALEARGVTVVDGGSPADAVVVGFDPAFDYDKLRSAFEAIKGGARLIGTNSDATYPTAGGEVPGGGSIVASVEYAAGRKAEIAGKPNQPSARLLEDRLGTIAWLIGDRADTDGAMACAIGANFGLVLSGVTESADGIDPVPTAVAVDLSTIVAELIAART